MAGFCSHGLSLCDWAARYIVSVPGKARSQAANHTLKPLPNPTTGSGHCVQLRPLHQHCRTSPPSVLLPSLHAAIPPLDSHDFWLRGSLHPSSINFSNDLHYSTEPALSKWRPTTPKKILCPRRRRATSSPSQSRVWRSTSKWVRALLSLRLRERNQPWTTIYIPKILPFWQTISPGSVLCRTWTSSATTATTFPTPIIN